MFNYCQKGDGLKAGDGVSSKIIEESGGGGGVRKKVASHRLGSTKNKIDGARGGSMKIDLIWSDAGILNINIVRTAPL